jgi:hypothetical protein
VVVGYWRMKEKETGHLVRLLLLLLLLLLFLMLLLSQQQQYWIGWSFLSWCLAFVSCKRGMCYNVN